VTQKRKRATGRLISYSEARRILHDGGYSRVGDKELADLEAALRETLEHRIRITRGHRATRKRGWRLNGWEAVFIGGVDTPRAKKKGGDIEEPSDR